MHKKLLVLGCGLNHEGQLAVGKTKILPRFTPIEAPTNMTAVACGHEHTLILDIAGQAWSTGACGSAQTGHLETKYQFEVIRDQLSPYTQIAAGKTHSLFLDDKGKISSVGGNTQGQLGYDSDDSYSSIIRHVRLPEKVKSISCGWQQSFAITESGQLFGWGCNIFSMLGDGTMCNSVLPVLIMKNEVEKVASGVAHTIALTRDGQLYVWGSNKNSQLGLPTSTRLVSSPTKLELPLEANDTIIDVAVGWYHTVILTKNGSVYLWGDNRVGQLGLGEDFAYSPTRNAKLNNIKSIGCGSQHSLFVDRDNNVLVAGSGTEFQLGQERGIYTEPMLVPFDSLGVSPGTLRPFAGSSHSILELLPNEPLSTVG
eukprot:TRINITY_DN8483_c0_g1_i1.p1 TRINITY_DN8483_c0_g1~~TRINITY_DN8483_c0_g1_i1.p1  ORF type:complete len:370 (-),score=40.36 TRINITY_DN8483_c0_g1_i1:34-1143(-)